MKIKFLVDRDGDVLIKLSTQWAKVVFSAFSYDRHGLFELELRLFQHCWSIQSYWEGWGWQFASYLDANRIPF